MASCIQIYFLKRFQSFYYGPSEKLLLFIFKKLIDFNYLGSIDCILVSEEASFHMIRETYSEREYEIASIDGRHIKFCQKFSDEFSLNFWITY